MCRNEPIESIAQKLWDDLAYRREGPWKSQARGDGQRGIRSSMNTPVLYNEHTVHSNSIYARIAENLSAGQ
jgi:hypothetical protein